MAKKNESLLGIYAESIGLYFSNFVEFFKYMSFPVIGQVAGLGLVFVFLYFYSQNLPRFIERNPNFNDFNTLIIISILIVLPGMAVFCKAFWEYLVAYGAVNSMLENMQKSGKVYDYSAHTQLISRRAFSFVILWFLLGIFALIGSIPFFWVVAGILAVYMTLVFQIFTFEPELSPIGCIKKSFYLIKGNFKQTFLLLVLSGGLTWLIFPQIFTKLLEFIGFTGFMAKLILPFTDLLSIDAMLANLPAEIHIPPITNMDIAKFSIEVIITQIIIQYSLPMRSILWALWYKKLDKSSSESGSVKSRKSSKRPSEKLMEASKKKYSKKKIDSNILKRAMEKDDEE